MSHEEYWKGVWSSAHSRLDRLFEDCSKDVECIVGNSLGIDSYEDAKCVLSYGLSHSETRDEKSCVILSVVDALHALREIEFIHSQAGA